jgi:segregation and condensation protein B
LSAIEPDEQTQEEQTSAPGDALAGPAPEPEAEANSAPASVEAGAPSEPIEEVTADQLFLPETQTAASETDDTRLMAVLEAVIYVTEEPLSGQQIALALNQPLDRIDRLLNELVAIYDRPERGLSIRQVAGGYKMATKPEHHEEVRTFVKNLKAPLKLSLAALETLAVIAYKQPITAPEIMEIRGVQGAGVLKTLLDRKLITTSGRKAVVGKPILYKTTKDFLVQFGLKDLNELPTLKEFEELRRMAFEGDAPTEPVPAPNPSELAAETPGAASPAAGEPEEPQQAEPAPQE